MSANSSNSVASTVALIPLRGGSKSIPLKNIKQMAGRPLCGWVLEAAFSARLFDSIVVSTEDERIADVVRAYTPTVTILKRPEELATDIASTESVMLHVASKIRFNVLCTIQATSPLTTAEDLRAAHRQFIASKADSMLTAVRLKRFLWNDDGVPLNYNPLRRPMRQAFGGTLMENGAFYYTRREVLERTGSRLGGKVEVFEMSEESATEIDEPKDWAIVEGLLRRRQGSRMAEMVRALKFMFFDVDGTLTDAAMYYSERGEELKRFSTRDGLGIRRLRDTGVEVGIITSEDSAIAAARAAKLGLEVVIVGTRDKGNALNEFCSRRHLDRASVGFMGDDLNDLPAFDRCGFTACPSDAMPEVRRRADFVSAADGGCGAVRELCDWLISMRAS